MWKYRALIALFLLTVLLPAGGCGIAPGNTVPPTRQEEKQEEDTRDRTLQLTYYGHSAFLIENSSKILAEPYSPGLGYGTIDLPADLITVSHNHFDHSYVEGGRGAAIIHGLTPEGEWSRVKENLGHVHLYTVSSYHDDQKGNRLGKNSIFVFETAGIRLVHLGDLGHSLETEQIDLIGKTDLLFIPVGGHYTLPYEEILQVIESLSPAVVIPVHYRTEYYRDQNLGTLEDFLNKKPPYPVFKKKSCLTIKREELPVSTEIWAMEFRLP